MDGPAVAFVGHMVGSKKQRTGEKRGPPTVGKGTKTNRVHKVVNRKSEMAKIAMGKGVAIRGNVSFYVRDCDCQKSSDVSFYVRDLSPPSTTLLGRPGYRHTAAYIYN